MDLLGLALVWLGLGLVWLFSCVESHLFLNRIYLVSLGSVLVWRFVCFVDCFAFPMYLLGLALVWLGLANEPDRLGLVLIFGTGLVCQAMIDLPSDWPSWLPLGEITRGLIRLRGVFS